MRMKEKGNGCIEVQRAASESLREKVSLRLHTEVEGRERKYQDENKMRVAPKSYCDDSS